MWELIVRFILRNRLTILIAVFLITVFMAWQGSKVRLSYEFAQMLPQSDSTYQEYLEFKKEFGEDGNVVFVGIQNPEIFKLNNFLGWFDLAENLKKIKGVNEVVCVSNVPTLKKDEEKKTFVFEPVFKQKPKTQEELDSLLKVVFSHPFYDQILFNTESGAVMMAVTLENEVLNSKARVDLVNTITKTVDSFMDAHGIEAHYSGLPFIRTKTALKIQRELVIFLILAIIVASATLYLFFRSRKAVLFPMIIVGISVIWAFGFIGILGYDISILTGIIPPLLIIIGVENCIFLLNKYHNEFKTNGNKIRSLSRVVSKIGKATMLTNLTTAVGFATFIITGNNLLVEFGIVASLNIISVFLLSLSLIPIFYSYLEPPQAKHVRHLENKSLRRIINKIIHIVTYHRTKVYVVSMVLLIFGVIGLFRLTTSGNMVDDIPHREKMYQDLMFFEKNIKGIMPFEIVVDTKKPNGVLQASTLEKIDELQQVIAEYPELSRPISVVEVLKFAKQGFYNGDPKMYSLPNRHERNFVLSYLPKGEQLQNGIVKALLDSTMQKTRIRIQMANIGTKDIQRIQDELRPRIDSIFNPEQTKVTITGSSVVFLKGTNYLVKNLFASLALAVVIIAFLISLLFNNFRMVFISLIPNLFPQLLTAAMMGWVGIPIKTSTILIFSIALGISVDNSIHFLAKFKQELRLNNMNIKDSVMCALKESGVSMIYSSVVLFFGFIIFTASSFGGTQALGYLIALTLFVALMSNLFLLPSILLTLHNKMTGAQLGKSENPLFKGSTLAMEELTIDEDSDDLAEDVDGTDSKE